MASKVQAADLFCGGGGTSTGLVLACQSLGVGIDLLAINHWDKAVEAHRANYPWAHHIQSRIEVVQPRKEVPGGHLNILVASPECTFHSVARGGRPINDQLRASPWHILPWLQELTVDAFLIENVPEFRRWGPLNAKGRPMKAQAGETYKAWLNACRSLGFNVGDKVLTSADFGDATSRERLFIQGRRGNKPLEWPTPMFSRHGKVPGTRPWRAAKEVIDWSLKGKSIFGRKKPLSPRTLARIMEGLRRFGGAQLQPFILPYFGERLGQKMRVQSVEDPLATVTSHGAGALVEPFLLPPTGYYQNGKGNAPRSTEEPVPTITAGRGGEIGIVTAFLVEMEHGGRIRSVEEPLPTITTARGGAMGVVEPYLVQYNGQSDAQPVSDPMPTITTKDRLALVTPVVNGQTMDIRFRMLTPEELSAAMGFPKGYYFAETKRDAVRMIGNAVSVQLAKHLCLKLLGKGGGKTLDDN